MNPILDSVAGPGQISAVGPGKCPQPGFFAVCQHILIYVYISRLTSGIYIFIYIYTQGVLGNFSLWLVTVSTAYLFIATFATVPFPYEVGIR